MAAGGWERVRYADDCPVRREGWRSPRHPDPYRQRAAITKKGAETSDFLLEKAARLDDKSSQMNARFGFARGSLKA
jgi:hypothetical protein